MLSELEYTVLTVVIDKKEHLARYGEWANNPYHYALAWLLERYSFYLEEKGATGDMMAEARGRKLDRDLMLEFDRLLTDGTPYVKAESLAGRLTSRRLKVRSKANNVAGLQLADLLAHPGLRAMRAQKLGEALPGGQFTTKVVKILEESKYRRSNAGQIDGYGRRWMP